MSVAFQITFRGIAPFDTARDIVLDKLGRIARRLPSSARCQVVLERLIDSHNIGSRLVHARVQLIGTGMQVSTVAREDDGADALRVALARAEERLIRQRGRRAERALVW